MHVVQWDHAHPVGGPGGDGGAFLPVSIAYIDSCATSRRLLCLVRLWLLLLRLRRRFLLLRLRFLLLRLRFLLLRLLLLLLSALLTDITNTASPVGPSVSQPVVRATDDASSRIQPPNCRPLEEKAKQRDDGPRLPLHSTYSTYRVGEP